MAKTKRRIKSSVVSNQPKAKQRRKRLVRSTPDYHILISVLLMTVIGLIFLYSIGGSIRYLQTGNINSENIFFSRQLIAASLGVIALIVVSKIDYHVYQKYAPLILVASTLFMLTTIIPGIGQTINGARRWIDIAGISFQPVEIYKLAICIYFADWISKRHHILAKVDKTHIPLVVVSMLSIFLTAIIQSDLGSATILIVMIMGMYFIAGGSLVALTGFVSTLLVFVYLAIKTTPYRVARIRTFIDPSSDLTGLGYHLDQALIALGSGGVIGKGFGNSYQIFGYLPESHTDSIIAIIGEQVGFVGLIILLTVIVYFIYRAILTIKQAEDIFGKVLAAGIATWFVWQITVNIGSMVGLMPLTGVPLPFISYGGSALISSFIAIGVLLNISKQTN